MKDLLKQVIQELIMFFVPPHCYGCGQVLQINLLFCRECLEMTHLLSKEERCPRCFSKGNISSCLSCAKFPIIYRRGALFDKEEILQPILKEKKKQSFLIASLFTWQFCRLGWPFFDFVASEPPLAKVGKAMAKIWKKPFHRSGKLPFTANILYLSEGNRRVDFPFSVMMGKIYHLSFFF